MTDTPPPDDLVERLNDVLSTIVGNMYASGATRDALVKRVRDIFAALQQKLEEAEECRGLAEIAERNAQSQRDALQAFKDFVHRRLDEAGVPTHPDGPHSKEGCRIGDRLDIVLRSAEHSWGMTLSADARAKQAEAQRDALAEALDEYGMWSNPNMFEQAANEITCDGSCENTWRESDTNASGCYREERGEYCPFIVAETLRAVGKCALASARAQAMGE